MSGTTSTAATVGAETYCEAIFELREDDNAVIQARLADRLGVSRPSVSEMVRRLRADGLLAPLDPIALTASGQALAERVVRRHRLAERFLTDVLGLSWAQAHHEAAAWEHVLTDTVEAAMVRVLGHPTTCPHGNPIPGSDYSPPAAVPLSDLAPAERFTVTRVTEELEFVDGMLEYLEGAGVRPGRDGCVEAIAADGTRTLRMSVEGTAVEGTASEGTSMEGTAEGVVGLAAYPAERILVLAGGHS